MFGYIDVGDGCWRPNVLVTSLTCWMILPPTYQISHHHKVTNVTMSPTSLSTADGTDENKTFIILLIGHQTIWNFVAGLKILKISNDFWDFHEIGKISNFCIGARSDSFQEKIAGFCQLEKMRKLKVFSFCIFTLRILSR